MKEKGMEIEFEDGELEIEIGGLKIEIGDDAK